MPLKLTMLFQVTTEPTDASAAIPHTGGWSESIWTTGSGFLPVQAMAAIAIARSNGLPKQAAITGFRQGLYTISGNKLLPGGTAVYKRLWPGNAANPTDLPQVALELSGTSQTSINSNRFTLRCIPDDMMKFGEYQPTPAFKAFVTVYSNLLTGQGGPLAQFGAFAFIGRDLAQPTAVVNSIAAGVVTLRGAVGGVANTDFLRLNRVYDDNGDPVKGSFLITAINGNAYTVLGLGGRTVATPSGTARIDKISIFNYQAISPVRAVVKKVGRPSQQYRGRRSKQRI